MQQSALQSVPFEWPISNRPRRSRSRANNSKHHRNSPSSPSNFPPPPSLYSLLPLIPLLPNFNLLFPYSFQPPSLQATQATILHPSTGRDGETSLNWLEFLKKPLWNLSNVSFPRTGGSEEQLMSCIVHHEGLCITDLMARRQCSHLFRAF